MRIFPDIFYFSSPTSLIPFHKCRPCGKKLVRPDCSNWCKLQSIFKILAEDHFSWKLCTYLLSLFSFLSLHFYVEISRSIFSVSWPPKPSRTPLLTTDMDMDFASLLFFFLDIRKWVYKYRRKESRN